MKGLINSKLRKNYRLVRVQCHTDEKVVHLIGIRKVRHGRSI